jgi:protein involved in polysaccharide export with SLBB domain
MKLGFAFVLVAVAIGCTTPRLDREQAIPASSQVGDTTAVELPRTISVLIRGEVGQPREYALPVGIRLSDAVESAGGFTTSAARKAVHLERKDGTRSVYNLRRAKPGGPQDPVLRDGDIVLVPSGAPVY